VGIIRHRLADSGYTSTNPITGDKMDRRSGKMFVGIGCLAAVAFVAVVKTRAQSGAGQPNNTSTIAKTTEQAYKNIQVLKGLPAERLIPAMQFITASLGVECSFCHVEGHFDQDDKKTKQTARKMMQMMMAINQQNFDNHRQVTCNTCHRGSPLPVSIPVISEGPPVLHMTEATNPEEQLPANLPPSQQLIEKYVQALGGAKAIEKVLTQVEKGTANFAGRAVEVDVYDKAPGKRLTIMHLPEGDSISAFNGQEGWLGAPGRPVREMHGPDIEAAKIDSDLQFPLHLKQTFGDLRPARPEKIDDRDTYQLIAGEADQPRVRLYFDQQSGLLIRMLRYSDSPLGLNPIRIDYADYRAVDGLQVPYRWTIARPAGQFTIQATEVKQNVAIEDEKFTKPAPAAQPEHNSDP
jgi:photosynthetic reaction center cytochrome c subunit